MTTGLKYASIKHIAEPSFFALSYYSILHTWQPWYTNFPIVCSLVTLIAFAAVRDASFMDLGVSFMVHFVWFVLNLDVDLLYLMTWKDEQRKADENKNEPKYFWGLVLDMRFDYYVTFTWGAGESINGTDWIDVKLQLFLHSNEQVVNSTWTR